MTHALICICVCMQGVTPDALANTSNHLVDAIATDSMPSRAPVRPSTMGVKDASQPQTVCIILASPVLLVCDYTAWCLACSHSK